FSFGNALGLCLGYNIFESSGGIFIIAFIIIGLAGQQVQIVLPFASRVMQLYAYGSFADNGVHIGEYLCGVFIRVEIKQRKQAVIIILNGTAHIGLRLIHFPVGIVIVIVAGKGILYGLSSEAPFPPSHGFISISLLLLLNFKFKGQFFLFLPVFFFEFPLGIPVGSCLGKAVAPCLPYNGHAVCRSEEHT